MTYKRKEVIGNATLYLLDAKKAKTLADKIIADYKEHYSFPWQGEGHMIDCIMDALSTLEGADEMVHKRLDWTLEDNAKKAIRIADLEGQVRKLNCGSTSAPQAKYSMQPHTEDVPIRGEGPAVADKE